MEELSFHKDKRKSHTYFKAWFSCHILQEASADPL